MLCHHPSKMEKSKETHVRNTCTHFPKHDRNTLQVSIFQGKIWNINNITDKYVGFFHRNFQTQKEMQHFYGGFLTP